MYLRQPGIHIYILFYSVISVPRSGLLSAAGHSAHAPGASVYSGSHVYSSNYSTSASGGIRGASVFTAPETVIPTIAV